MDGCNIFVIQTHDRANTFGEIGRKKKLPLNWLIWQMAGKLKLKGKVGAHKKKNNGFAAEIYPNEHGSLA